MRILLDTHAVIWWVDQDGLLSLASHAAIADPANELLVSAATVWEIAIKLGIARLSLVGAVSTVDEPGAGRLTKRQFFPSRWSTRRGRWELPNHHRDPFDRLLIAQALVEDVPVVSADTTFEQYGVKRIW